MALSNIDVSRGAFAITPSDTVPLLVNAMGLVIGGAGTLKVTCVDGSVAVFAAVTAAQIIPLAVTLVWATGTSATGIVGLK